MLINYKNIKTFFFDLDGTIWNWKDFNPQMRHIIERLEKKHKKVYFVTNNTTLSKKGYSQKFSRMGLQISEEQIITAGYVAAKYLQSKGVTSAYVIGEQGLISDLSTQGITVTEESKTVIVSYDRNFTYSKLKTVTDLVTKGAKLYTTGRETHWLVGKEKYPAVGSILAAVETATKIKAENLGKPGTLMKQRILEDIFLFPEDCLFIGDELIDVEFGSMCGFRTAIILSDMESEINIKKAKGTLKPDTIIRDSRELIAGL
ncbi:HAD-IIA family hydrolase [archaeon]|nr:HAD-IIA family hydrolase [archaeon]